MYDDSLGRNGYDLDEIVEFLLKKGVQINFVREGIVLGKKNDIMSKLAYDMMKSFIHFFLSFQKSNKGLALKKQRRRQVLGRARVITKEKGEYIKQQLLTTRKSKRKIAAEVGIY